jgi:pimeloyl-ACP methyl ester carboxylesterase
MMIQAWSFGVSRIIDYLVTDSDIDASKICTIGHSRGGKVSILTAAQDERVAYTMVNNAGTTGDKLFRSNRGRTIQDTNDDFWWWYPDTYLAYNGQDTTIPYDMHQLISLVAPRLVAAGTAAADAGANPVGQFHSYVFAQPAFKLYGKIDTTWEVGDTPSLSIGPNALMRNGNIQFHMRREGDRAHNLLLLDWEYYLEFADLKL